VRTQAYVNVGNHAGPFTHTFARTFAHMRLCSHGIRSGWLCSYG